MFGQPRTGILPRLVLTAPPPPITSAEHEQRVAAGKRLAPKWDAVDRLVADYRAADNAYRRGR